MDVSDIRNGCPYCNLGISVHSFGFPRDAVSWSVVKYRRGYVRNHDSSLEELRQAVEDILLRLHGPDPKLPVVAYYPTNRRVMDLSVRRGAEGASSPIDAYDVSATGGTVDFQAFFEWFREREDAENRIRLRESPVFRDHALEAVRRALGEIFPGYTDLHVEQSGQSLVLTKVTGDSGSDILFTQLSDGEKCGVALVADIARRLAIANPVLTDPLNGEGVVLIDEIELHLHPRWQRSIMSRLTGAFPNCQFIISTHSPQVVSELKTAYVYLLKPASDGITCTRVDPLYGRDTNRILEDVMGGDTYPGGSYGEYLLSRENGGRLLKVQSKRGDGSRHGGSQGRAAQEHVYAGRLIRHGDSRPGLENNGAVC